MPALETPDTLFGVRHMKDHFEYSSNQNQRLPFETFLVSFVILLLLPFFLSNIFTAVLLGMPIVISKKSGGRSFSVGFFKKSIELCDVVLGRKNIIAVPVQRDSILMPDGIVSVWGLRQLSGLVAADFQECLIEQSNLTLLGRYKLVVRYTLCSLLYGNRALKSCRAFSIFGVRIDNVRMEQAVQSIIAQRNNQNPAIGCFVNVNSLNLAYSTPSLRDAINRSDFVYADGSGVRLAAKRRGIALKDNVNGTDMLPLLCQQASQQGKSLFFLGGSLGVAEKASQNLQQMFPGLRIVGCQNGYFDKRNCDHILKIINGSGANILLVGFGSPLQECWLHERRNELRVDVALAVGGLFDFFSGNIPRAPIWMREMGMEWIWRLLQEPKAKFKRYVLGNPLFIFRMTFVK